MSGIHRAGRISRSSDQEGATAQSNAFKQRYPRQRFWHNAVLTLRHVFKYTLLLLGPSAPSIAIEFLKKHPPGLHGVNSVGNMFPNFLARLDDNLSPEKALPYPGRLLSEIADFELARYSIFVGARSSREPIETSTISGEGAPDFLIIINPTVLLRSYTYPVDTIIKNLLDCPLSFSVIEEAKPLALFKHPKTGRFTAQKLSELEYALVELSCNRPLSYAAIDGLDLSPEDYATVVNGLIKHGIYLGGRNQRRRPNKR